MSDLGLLNAAIIDASHSLTVYFLLTELALAVRQTPTNAPSERATASVEVTTP
jgi:hypothetical protein